MRTQICTRSQTHQTRGHTSPGRPSPCSLGQTHTASRVPPARTRVRAGTQGLTVAHSRAPLFPGPTEKGACAHSQSHPHSVLERACTRLCTNLPPLLLHSLTRGLGVRERTGTGELAALPGERNVEDCTLAPGAPRGGGEGDPGAHLLWKTWEGTSP